MFSIFRVSSLPHYTKTFHPNFLQSNKNSFIHQNKNTQYSRMHKTKVGYFAVHAKHPTYINHQKLDLFNIVFFLSRISEINLLFVIFLLSDKSWLRQLLIVARDFDLFSVF